MSKKKIRVLFILLIIILSIVFLYINVVKDSKPNVDIEYHVNPQDKILDGARKIGAENEKEVYLKKSGNSSTIYINYMDPVVTSKGKVWSVTTFGKIAVINFKGSYDPDSSGIRLFATTKHIVEINIDKKISNVKLVDLGN